LQTGNAALVAAAADQMHANAADVGGNNIPVTGGTYNADGLTVADALSTAVAAPAVAVAATVAAPAAPVVQTAASATPAPAAQADAAVHHGPAAADAHQGHFAELAQHLHHMWG
jgi:hypothetical protein